MLNWQERKREILNAIQREGKKNLLPDELLHFLLEGAKRALERFPLAGWVEVHGRVSAHDANGTLARAS
ncbi:hypothetical protein [Thermus hydrothermalis]|uniref:hypothetical protein n=1 Tax=Thermus hydrothermalis TaxID=2908148 RepID=UPI001FA9BD0C|nr:hypothetical protein [Thermus hydrothermalis]